MKESKKGIIGVPLQELLEIIMVAVVAVVISFIAISLISSFFFKSNEDTLVSNNVHEFDSRIKYMIKNNVKEELYFPLFLNDYNMKDYSYPKCSHSLCFFNVDDTLKFYLDYDFYVTVDNSILVDFLLDKSPTAYDIKITEEDILIKPSPLFDLDFLEMTDEEKAQFQRNQDFLQDNIAP